ncbi:hypothetical protein GCM10027082_24160 [Comamonas humi]
MSLILTKEQAEAVYSAMCALNNVSSLLRNVEMKNRHGHTIQVRENADGKVVVTVNTGGIVLDSNIEFHADQSAFATAYGLQ